MDSQSYTQEPPNLQASRHDQTEVALNVDRVLDASDASIASVKSVQQDADRLDSIARQATYDGQANEHLQDLALRSLLEATIADDWIDDAPFA